MIDGGEVATFALARISSTNLSSEMIRLQRHRRASSNGTIDRLGRVRRGFWPQAEVFEERRLLTLTLGDASIFSSYVGVGFGLNPVALIYGTYNGQPDLNPNDYRVQIDWGDGSSRDTSASLVGVSTGGGTGYVLVKGSHIYKQQKTDYPVTVYVTGPDGQSVSGQTTAVIAVPMPDPTSQPITVPTAYKGAQPLGVETLTLGDASIFSSYVGVGFGLNPVALIYGTYNGPPDLNRSDYRAQIDWGDGNSWDTNTSLVAVSTGGGTGYVLVKGSHVYKQQGTYDVVVYVTGPDGQTVSSQTTAVTVSTRPNELVASLNPNANVFSATAGQMLKGYVATVQTVDPNAVVTGLTAQIDNGDGSHPSSGHFVEVGPGQVWQVTNPYTYNTPGTFTLTIRITDDQQDLVTLQGRVTVTTPTSPTPTSPTPTSPTPTSSTGTTTTPTPTSPTPTSTKPGRHSGSKSRRLGGYVIANAQNLAAHVFNGYSGAPIQIAQVRNLPRTYLVMLSGTELLNLGQATNIPDDIAAENNSGGAYYAAISRAIRHNIPRGARVILAGHSLGGMEAENIVDDPRLNRNYRFTDVITFGSPKTKARQDPRVTYTAFDLNGDPVIKQFSFYQWQPPASVYILPNPWMNDLSSVGGHNNYQDDTLLNQFDSLGRLHGRVEMRIGPITRVGAPYFGH